MKETATHTLVGCAYISKNDDGAMDANMMTTTLMHAHTHNSKYARKRNKTVVFLHGVCDGSGERATIAHWYACTSEMCVCVCANASASAVSGISG